MNIFFQKSFLIIVAVVLISFIVSDFVGPIIAWAGICAAILGLMLIGKPRFYMWLILAWSLVSGSLMAYIPIVKVMDEFLWAGMLALTIIPFLIHSKNENSVSDNKYKNIVLGAIGFILISSLFNRINLLSLALFFKGYVLFPLMFFFAKRYFKPSDIKQFSLIFIWWVILQFPLNLCFMFGVLRPPNPEYVYFYDYAQGTMGSQLFMAYVSIIALLFLNALFSCKAYITKIWVYLITSFIVLCGFFITYTVHAYIILAGCGIVYFLSNLRRIKYKLVITITAVLAGVVLMSYNASQKKEYQNKSINYFDAQMISQKILEFEYSPKGVSYANSFKIIPKEKKFAPFIGVGPGGYMSSPALMRPTDLTYRFLGDFYLTQSGSESRAGGSILVNPLVGICALVAELGYFGFTLYLLIFLYPCYRVIKLLHKNAFIDPFQKSLAMVYLANIALFLGINFLIDAWSYWVFVGLFGFWTAFVWDPINSENRVPTLNH